jgi:hypothetical protein
MATRGDSYQFGPGRYLLDGSDQTNRCCLFRSVNQLLQVGVTTLVHLAKWEGAQILQAIDLGILDPQHCRRQLLVLVLVWLDVDYVVSDKGFYSMW